uniref:Poly(A) binding protein, nuclear 1 n=1 Tax=Cyprinus carpio TaxID=7962 RepID=A0A8C2CX84_CYPCA
MAEFGNGLAEESLLDSDPGHSELEDPGVGDEEPGLDEGEAAIDDPELEAIKARVREMEEEAEKLKELQNEVEKQMNLSPPPAGPVIMSIEEKMEADGRSIYVGNVDYGATAEELEAHFHGCGSVNRVTILCDKFTGHPKGICSG